MILMPKRNEFNMLDDFFQSPFFAKQEGSVMKADIKENEAEYEIIIDLPGYSKDNIKISIESGYLTIQASICKETNEGNDEKFIRRERYCGEISRNFYIGNEIKPEEIKASFKNGVLNLKVPKKEEKQTIKANKYIQITD